MNELTKKSFYLTILGLLLILLATNVFSGGGGLEVIVSYGDYVKDPNPALTADFYNNSKGLKFDGVKTYEKGDFYKYTLLYENLSTESADILRNGTYDNEYSLLSILPTSILSSPSHPMNETITINSSKIRYYEDGLNDGDTETLKMAVDENAIKYTINMGYIPVEHMSAGNSTFTDLEYRGKIIFLGEEYYLKDIDAGKIYLSKGRIIDIHSEGYTDGYHGYRFKIDHLNHKDGCEGKIMGMWVDVVKPNDNIEEVRSFINSSVFVGEVDDLEIKAISANDAAVATGVINITNTSNSTTTSLDINSAGYTSKWGYKFKIGYVITDCTIAEEIVLDVMKPDGTVVEGKVTPTSNLAVDYLEIAGLYAEAVGAFNFANIIIYNRNTSTDLILEDGEDIDVGGIAYNGWRVSWKNFAGNCSSLSCGITEYENSSADVLEKIEVTLTDDVEGIDALKVGESIPFPRRFMLKFRGYLDDVLGTTNCSADCPVSIEKDYQEHRLLLSFTGGNGRRYNKVWLDEGPFSRGDLFILDGKVTKYRGLLRGIGGDESEDNATVFLTSMNESMRHITLNRLCDPDSSDNNTFENCTIGGAPTCGCIGMNDLELRIISLVDAMDDIDPSKYEKDDSVILNPEDLFWAADTGTNQSLVIWLEENSKVIFYSTDENDRWITTEPKMVNPGSSPTDDTYKIDYLSLENRKMWLLRECDFENDVNASNKNESCDLNYDASGIFPGGNDDDLLIIFESGSGSEYMVLDLTDRGYDEGYNWRFSNRMGLYSNWSMTNRTENKNNLLGEYTTDTLSVMTTPSNGDEYTIDWGVDNEIEGMDICRSANNILIDQSSDVYQLLLSFTGVEGDRYVDARLDEGPFIRWDTFLLDSEVTEFNGYKKEDGVAEKDDNFTITLKNKVNGSARNVTLYRLCDPLGSGTSTFGDCTPGGTPTCNCTGLTDPLQFRKISLIDAMDDIDPSKYEYDDDFLLDPEDLFWAADAGTNQSLVIWFDESSNAMLYSIDENDRWVTIEPRMVNPDASTTNNAYKINASGILIWLLRECDFENDVNASNKNESCDLNYDASGIFPGGNDDDLLIIFESGSGYTVLDLTDRGYDEGYDWRFSNSLGLYSNWSMTNRTENKNNLIVDLDEDVDTLLITPVDGDQYTIDWGVDNQITDLDICHPTEDLKATYFIGLSPERTRTFIANDKVSVIVNKTNTVNLSEVNVTLDIIADGTLDSDVNATIYVNASSYFEEIVGTYLLSSPLGRYVEINVDDSLASNLTSMLIRFYYSDSDVTAAGLVESLLRLHRYDGDTDTWVPLTTDLYWVFGSGVDTTNNYVWANTSKFSIYGIGEGTTTTTVVTTTTTTIYYRGGSSGGGGGISGAKPLPSCFDGIMNCHDGGCEEGVDCGGPCSPCMSCSDGIQNQGEEGIDCGGPCAPCQTVTSTTVTTTISPPSTIKSVTSTIETSTTTSMAEITTTTIQVKGGAFPMTTAVIIAEVIIIVGLIVFFVKVKGR